MSRFLNLGARFLQLYQETRASYWFLPSLMLVIAVLLSLLTAWLDRRVDGGWILEVTGFARARPDGSQAILVTIAGSIIGVAGVVFSTTMVAVSFASGTYGPRLIGNFMRDRGNQLSLGVFVSTFLYALLVLRTVRSTPIDDQGAVFVPHVSLAVAMTLAVLCICTLVYFIHHVPEAINIENIVADLGRQLRLQIDREFDSGRLSVESASDRWPDGHAVVAARDGILQAVDYRALSDLAQRNEAAIAVRVRAGQFIVAGDAIAEVRSHEPPASDLEASLVAAFAIGRSRTSTPSIEIVTDQLVEIIARALSPGMNDPFTAIACLNWLEAGARHWMRRSADFDRSDAYPGVTIAGPTLERFLDAALVRALPYLRDDENVMAELRGLTSRLTDHATDPGQRRVTASLSRKIA